MPGFLQEKLGESGWIRLEVVEENFGFLPEKLISQTIYGGLDNVISLISPWTAPLGN